MNGYQGFYYIAQAYNCDAYGSGQYGECVTTSTGTSDSDSLVDTGLAVGLFVGIAALLVFITVLVMVLRRKSKKAKTTPKKPLEASIPMPTVETAAKSTPQPPVQRPQNTDIIRPGKEN